MKWFFYLACFFTSLGSIAQDSISYYNTQIQLKSVHNKLENSEILFQKKINYLKNKDNLEEFFYSFYAYFSINKKADRFAMLSKIKALQWRNPKNNKEELALLYLKINIGREYLDAGLIEESIQFYEESLFLYQNNVALKYDIVEYCLKPLANNYTRLGDYARAENLLKTTIQLTENKSNTINLIASYINLSIIYQSTNKLEKAIKLLEKALEIKPISVSQKSILVSELGKNYYQKHQYNKAIKFCNQSLHLSDYKSTKQKNYATIGLSYFNLEKFKKAVVYFNKSLSLSKEVYGQNHRETAKIYQLIAAVYSQQNDFTKALQFYQKALQSVLPKYQPKDVFDNPNPVNFYAENTIKDALDGRAQIFTKKQDFKNAIKNYDIAFKSEEILMYSINSQKSKIRLQTENKNRSEKIVALYYNLYQNTHEITNLEKAFNSVEKSKANVLFNLLQNKYLRNEIKKDTLFRLEKKLRKEKAILTKNMLVEELKKEHANIEKLQFYNTKKSEISTKLQIIKKEIQHKYPFLNAIRKEISTKEIQQEFLTNKQILIEFFTTKKYIYIFSLEKNEPITLRKITKDSIFKKKLQQFINLFNTGSGTAIKSDFKTYQKLGFYLYKKLLAPELAHNIGSSVTIIPDGKLNFVAFDALLTEINTSTNFEKQAYLLYQNPINLGFSTTILQLQKKIKTTTTNNKLLGFFPVFENKHRNLQELTYTLNEKKSIQNSIKGSYYKKEKALKKTFIEKASNYRIIHLSTHASSGTFEKPAHIEFFDETLYLSEIYGLDLPNDLVVLSACETGIGKLQKGEGAMSLARGFSYAGVKNLIVSLWKVNDKATSILMHNFYQNYTKTNAKTYAIQQAKIDYLQNKNISNAKKSPYYWSSFVFIGNIEVAQIPTENNWLTSVIIGVTFILLITIFYKKFKQKKRIQK